MVPVASAQSPFHARVLAARLGADGIVTRLQGSVDGPYPAFGDIAVLVSVDDFEIARDLLMADRLDGALEADDDGGAGRAVSAAARWWMAAAVVMVAFCAVCARGV